jgi:very-short-patch-repair endonuclease
MGVSGSDASTNVGLVRATIEKLRAKLLDLTMANRLLNFKPSDKSKSHIRVIDETPEALFTRLESRKEMEFAWIDESDLESPEEMTPEFTNAVKLGKATDIEYLEQLEKLGKRPSRRQLSNLDRELRNRIRAVMGLSSRTKQSPADRARELGIDPSYDLPTNQRNSKQPRSDSKVQTLHYREVMEAKVSAIRENDKTLLDDAGVNALYAAFGAAEWYESPDSDIALFAPLVFVPVEIRRALDRGVYRHLLIARDDEIETNQAFAELIKQTHSLELPAWNPEGTLAEYFESCQALLQSQRKWSLRRWVTIGLFTFAKIAMYRDLDTKRWSSTGDLASHAIIHDLLAGSDSISGTATYAPDYEIDSPEIDSRNQTIVTDADSSQHSALVDVSEGKQLVIQGPPGTGKSQTITNIIASALNGGKRVLFVAEKMAALKVVKDRLDSFGLGEFCLEVHSNKTRKATVLKSFEDRLNLPASSLDDRQLRQALESFENARTDLIHYAAKMKEDAGDTGLNVYEVLCGSSTRTQLGETLPIGLRRARVQDPKTVTQQQRLEIQELASCLRANATAMSQWGGLASHPWRGVENQDIDVFGSDELKSELALWAEALASLQATLADIKVTTRLPIEDTGKALQSFVTQIMSVPDMPDDVVESVVQTAANDPSLIAIRGLLRDVDALALLTDRLNAVFDDAASVNAIHAENLLEIVNHARLLQMESLTTDEIEKVSIENEKRFVQLRSGLGTLTEFGDLMAIDEPNVSDVGNMVSVAYLAAELPVSTLRLREPTLVEEGATSVLERGSRQTEALQRLRAIIEKDFRIVASPAAAEIRSAADVLENGGLFSRLFSPTYRRARAFYRGLAQTSPGRTERNPGQELRRLVQFLEQKQELENNSEFRHVAGLHFRGLDTQWKDLVTVSRWASKVRRELPGEKSTTDVCRELLLRGESTKLEAIIRLAKKEGKLAALKLFLDFGAPADQPIDSLYKSTEIVAARTDQLSDRLKKYRVDRNVVLSALRNAAADLTELEAVKTRLDSVEARELLKNVTLDHGPSSELLRKALAFLDALAAADLPQQLREMLFHGSVRQNIRRFKDLAYEAADGLNAVANHHAAVKRIARLNERAWVGCDDLCEVSTEKLKARIDRALADKEALEPYLDFLRIEGQARASKLGPMLRHLENTLPAYAQIGEAYDFLFFRSCAESILSEDPKLRAHSGVTHEQLRKRYQQLDRKIMELRRLDIVRKLRDMPVEHGYNSGRSSERTELSLIRHQIGLQRRHIALRELFKRASRAAQALKPCFMMSPMSVAQFLDPDGMRFDLVVMDEASQIRPEDALGAIARGRQLVVVGDPKQLPPTSFFEKVDRDESPDENSDEADIHDLTSQESILDLARGPYQPIRQLRWHYRSQHEKLIAFSNHEFYDDSLVVFPSPRGDDPNYGIHLVPLEGVYEAGLNRIEAEAIVEAAQDLMHRFAEKSLGIVAMNKTQQELIQKMMDELFATDVEAEAYRLRWENSLDSIFVKNLENVQGDERDVIFISTVYGKDAAGNFFQRLGPINGAHGHRRLNVLFTRAKQQVRLFTSMKSGDLRVDSGARWGVKALKNYLAFAETGHLNSSEITGREPDSDFERWVIDLLHEKGYETSPQLGVAGYFIDLAVRHPDRLGSFILGVECDGAMYHSARSVRDRDRLRQEVLERLGWTIYRIWSTDWFRNPRSEFNKLTAKIEKLREDSRPNT